MSLLSNLKTNEVIQDEVDTLGGGGLLDSEIYLSNITMAYLTKAASGALGLFVSLKTDSGREHRETLYVTSGNAKGNKPYSEVDGEKRFLPGYTLANNLCLLTVGKELADMTEEEKVVPIYNYDTKTEVPTKVPVLVELLGKPIYAGIHRQTVNKRVKNDATGEYEDSPETRDENVLDKFFRERDKMTAAEIRAQAQEPVFFGQWREKWAGQVRDRSNKSASKGGSTIANFGQAKASAGKPEKSLFA